MVLLVFLGWVFRGDLSVWCYEDVAGRHARAVVVFDFPFQGADLGELDVVSVEGVRGPGATYCHKGHQVRIMARCDGISG